MIEQVIESKTLIDGTEMKYVKCQPQLSSSASQIYSKDRQER